MHSYAASDLAIFRRVRVPAALPFVFTALKVASVLAMIGAVVGEYFGGSQEQLGVAIRTPVALFNFETAWAAIMVACVLGLGSTSRSAGRAARRAPASRARTPRHEKGVVRSIDARRRSAG